MGVALGRSLQRFCPDLPRAVVTDQVDGELHQLFDHVIPLEPDRGKDVVQKLYLDRYTPFQATLFIDCDCLAFGPLDYVFEGLRGGKTIIPDKLYFHHVGHPKQGIDFVILEQKTGLSKLPGFNGGVYYIEKGTASERIFERARDILPNYSDYGIGKFRSGPNDEIVLSIAMALEGHESTPLPKHVMRETYGLSGSIDLDSINGRARLRCYDTDYEPSIVHFCSGWRDQLAYTQEMKKLKALQSGLPLSVMRARWIDFAYPRWVAFKQSLQSLSKRLWSCVPKPCRLTYHAIANRLGKRS